MHSKDAHLSARGATFQQRVRHTRPASYIVQDLPSQQSVTWQAPTSCSHPFLIHSFASVADPILARHAVTPDQTDPETMMLIQAVRSLAMAHHVQSQSACMQAGIRPLRTSGVRVQLDHVPHPSAGTAGVPLVHNYGHGGSGITLHWGCVEQALEYVADDLSRIDEDADDAAAVNVTHTLLL